MATGLRDFLELPYGELEDLNLQAKQERKDRIAPGIIQEQRLRYLTDTPGIKAVTVPVSYTHLDSALPKTPAASPR